MPGVFERFKAGLAKTRQRFLGPLGDILSGNRKIDQELYEELEEVLVSADVGMATAKKLLDRVAERVKQEKTQDASDVRRFLQDAIIELLNVKSVEVDPGEPKVIMVVGVNGVGKTTSIAKLASFYRQAGQELLLVAGDTFRAAAADQLTIWAERLEVPIIAHNEGGDPAAVVFDGLASANAHKTPIVIVDTAGRIHTKANLLSELGKIQRVLVQNKGERKLQVLLVLDATTGQNAIAQAKTFNEVAGIDGIILTKLDGTAKGGIVIAIADQLNLPIVWIGVGEGVDDLRPFDASEFAEALFAEE
ncbi:MAG TPA: signal recognition particle-docking protein FtsY [Bacillota bacterium]|nr:signal recognition particle-docking protein FtsY [Bacillota bacterium]